MGLFKEDPPNAVIYAGKEEQRIWQNVPIKKYLSGYLVVWAPLLCKLL